MNSSNSSNESNAHIELKHIQIELRHRQDRPQHMRHFVDQYYCYQNGHVRRTGAPNWGAIVGKGYVSQKAKEVLNDRKRVVLEHVVPLKVICEMLKELSNNGEVELQGIAKVLNENVKFATITKAEDQRLRDLGLISKMPEGFHTEGHERYRDLFARYMCAGIEISHDSSVGG